MAYNSSALNVVFLAARPVNVSKSTVPWLMIRGRNLFITLDRFAISSTPQ
jgi:hypothetical protein